MWLSRGAMNPNYCAPSLLQEWLKDTAPHGQWKALLHMEATNKGFISNKKEMSEDSDDN